jgi:hypothetical protein
MDAVFTRHSGPFQLVIMRPMTAKAGFYRNTLLRGESEAEDVEDEARALLADPRDTIVLVSVWSVPDKPTRSEQMLNSRSVFLLDVDDKPISVRLAEDWLALPRGTLYRRFRGRRVR